MTIHTGWMQVMRREAAVAFQETIPGGDTHRSQATFIDGQIKLMKADIIQTWAHFLYSQFTCIINRHFHEYACQTVVLAFDDKRFVPQAKAITQAKRRDGVKILEFGENDVLPNEVPVWKEAIMNHTLRTRSFSSFATVFRILYEGSPDAGLLSIGRPFQRMNTALMGCLLLVPRFKNPLLV